MQMKAANQYQRTNVKNYPMNNIINHGIHYNKLQQLDIRHSFK